MGRVGTGRSRALALAIWAGLVMAPAAAAANRLNVQGQLLNASGSPVDGSYTIKFTLYDASKGGTALWTETLSDVPATNGVFDTMLGATTAIGVDVFRANDNVWLGVKIEAGPGVPVGGEAELPRKEITSVGYAIEAMHAKEADNAKSAESALDVACDGCVGVSELEFDPTTQAELDAALLGLGATLGQLSCAKDEFPQYDGTTWGCAKTTTSSTDLECSGCVADTELGFDPATQAELDSAVASLSALIPTSVDGMAGGTLTSGLNVEGVITSNGNEVCTKAGNCGTSLASLACTTDQIARFDGDQWVCADLVQGAAAPPPCTGAYRTLQFDGAAWKCVDINKTGLSAGKANGYEATDNWGYAWDGSQRTAATWANAKAACEAIGARLPTATELFRNNSTTGTGNISDPTDTSPLWTIIRAHPGASNAAQRVTIALSNGAVGYALETATAAYRCVWPDHTSTTFEGDYCFGPPGKECVGKRWWNLDQMDRPALTYAAAVNECAFYNASIPTEQMFGEMARAGWANPPGTSWHWLNDPSLWYSGKYGMALGRWTANPQPTWQYDNTNSFASVNVTGTNAYRFRCVGKRSATEGYIAATPTCQTACYTMDKGRKARLVADGSDRLAATYSVAQDTCKSLGGALPEVSELVELVHSGLTNGTNTYLWTTDFEQIPASTAVNQYGYMRLRWPVGTGVADYQPDMSAQIAGTNTNAYRCVWRETFEADDAITACKATEVQAWTGTGFTCKAAVNGTSCDAEGKNCKGYPSGLQHVDAWGNAWDNSDRPQVTYATAAATCAGLGARLPTATELYRVRVGQSQSLPTATTNYLWTLVPHYTAPNQITVRANDGATSSSAPGSSLYYRCIWPVTKGDAFGSAACNGDPAAPCYQKDHQRIDKIDRAALPFSSAAWECAYYGGRLPNASTWIELMRGETPNGTNAWLWLDEPELWTTYSGGSYSNAGYGYKVVRWSGTSAINWLYDSTTGSYSEETTARQFRCVFSDRLQ